MFENFPYSNFHDLNTDWLIKRVKNVETSEANAKESEEAAAESAAAAAQSATASAQSAQASAQSAQESAQSAEESANSATEADNYVASTRAQVNLLQARVDNIIPSGTQTEGNTELLDIRVDFLGQTYESAGDGVRAQASYLDDKINTKTNDLKNDFATINVGDYAFKIIPDVYINIETGNEQAYSGWSVSDFVPLTMSRCTKITCVSTIAYSIVYDENKTKIRQFTLAQGDNYLTAENGAYIRFSDDSAKVAKTKIQLVNVDPSLTLPYVGGDAKTIGDLFKRVVLTHDMAGYVSGDISAFTSDNTNDFNKIDRSCFIPVVGLTSANKPSDFTHGFVLSVKSATGADGLYQALYTTTGKLVYYRAKWTYGAEWGDFISTAKSQNLQFVEAFKRVTVIGDSITVGFMPNVGRSGGITDTSYSWQNHVFKDAEISTCAKGGASARTFFTDTVLNTSLNSIPSNSQCVVIYLGTNPVKDDSDTELPYGTASDVVASYDATPTETWVGYYSKLIKTVQHICPNTPIIIVGLVLQTQRNPTIELCADECGIIYVDGSRFNNNEWNIADNNDWWHCTAIGYIGRANVMRKAINYAISQNLATFNAIQTIS